MVSLRNEIMEAQKTRSDLMKWKVVLVSSLGAVGLGITEIHTVDKIKFVPGLVLCLIPFVCIYVDSLCRHLMCKILVIGRFLAMHDPKDPELLCKYEKFTEKARQMDFKIFKVEKPKLSAFAFENFTLPVSSMILCIVLIIISFSFGAVEKAMVLFSGILGIVISIIVEFIYKMQRSQIVKLPKISSRESKFLLSE